MTAAQTAAISDPAEFARTGQWVPVAIGVAAAPVPSTLEDVTSLSLTFVAILLPALVLIILIASIGAAVWLQRRRRRRQTATQGGVQ